MVNRMKRLVPRLLLATALIILAGCQTSASTLRHRTAPDDHTLAQLADILPGDYDNHEQVARARIQDQGGTGIVPLHVSHALRLVEQDRESLSWEWRLQTDKRAEPSIWLMRAQIAAGGGVRITPSRPTDPAAAKARFDDAATLLRFEAPQWAQLDACVATGKWTADKFAASADSESCSALLPGLGEDAALLPLRFSIAGDMLEAQAFADLPRGADAVEQARRVRWFGGWTAINGGGPHATAANQDWHVQRDVRIGSEGGRVALRWRDGAASGYTLELERTTYPERKLSVLQLNVIEDASGKTMTYAWSDALSDSIGLNLGWLQAGFVHESPARKDAR